MSVASDTMYQNALVDEPLMMDEPEFLVDLNRRSMPDIEGVLRSLTPKEKLQMVTYTYMNVVHLRASEEHEYAGLKGFTFNEMTLFSPEVHIDDVCDPIVMKLKQAPERSGKTAQHLLDALLNIHMGRNGFIMIGSPKDNVEDVTTSLNKNLDLFKKHITDRYERVNDVFKKVFGKYMWGIDTFVQLDGASELVDHRHEIPKKKSENYHLVGRFLNGSSMPVISATANLPVKTIYKLLHHMLTHGVDYFMLLDEADSIFKTIASGMKTDMAKTLLCVMGMTDDYGSTQIKRPGSYLGAKKIMLLSATMNLAVEYLSSLPGDEPVTVRAPYSQRAQTLLGGVNNHTFIPIDTNDVAGSLKSFLCDYFTTTNPLEPTYNFEYHLDNDYIIADMENEKTRPIEYFASRKPLIKTGSYLYPKFKTNSAALVQGSSFVNGVGNRKNVSSSDETANQMRMLAAYFGKDSVYDFVPDDAIAITYFAGGARIWFRDQRYGPAGVSVSTIIKHEELEAAVSDDRLTASEEQDALKIINEFKEADENIYNAMSFISWFYGVHVPIVVFAFNKALRAIDCRDREHAIIRQFIIVPDSQGADNEKQIAGRSKASKGEMLRLNFPVHHDDDDMNFKVAIAANVSLEDAATLEDLPYQTEIENGKRVVSGVVKEAVKRKHVLPKAARRYEPKANGMRVSGETDERAVERPEPEHLSIDLNWIWGKLAHFLMAEAADRVYHRAELRQIFAELRNSGRVVFGGNTDVKVHELKHRHFISQIGTDAYRINKHIPYTIEA